jgi:hypothetical protein
MPIRRLLEGGSFHADSVAILVDAFNGVVDELGLQVPAERERAARLINRLARGHTELDTAKIRASAIAELRG